MEIITLFTEIEIVSTIPEVKEAIWRLMEHPDTLSSEGTVWPGSKFKYLDLHGAIRSAADTFEPEQVKFGEKFGRGCDSRQEVAEILSLILRAVPDNHFGGLWPRPQSEQDWATIHDDHDALFVLARSIQATEELEINLTEQIAVVGADKPVISVSELWKIGGPEGGMS